jgi:hypothetical protein
MRERREFNAQHEFETSAVLTISSWATDLGLKNRSAHGEASSRDHLDGGGVNLF